MYIVIEIQHDAAAKKQPWAATSKYSNGRTITYNDKSTAESAAASAVNDPHNGIIRTRIEFIADLV